MNTVSPVVKEFFERYEHGSNTLDLDIIASEYDDVFMFADPNGVRVVEKQRFLGALPARREFVKSHGHQFTKVVSCTDSPLDERYVLVRVQVLMHFAQASAPPVDAHLDSTYILYLQENSPKIVFQLEHQDLQQAMQALGLLPAKQ